MTSGLVILWQFRTLLSTKLSGVLLAGLLLNPFLGWGCADHVRAVTLIGLTRLSPCETVPKFSQEQSMSMPPEQPYPAWGATLQQTDLPEEEIPTQRNPRVVMPTQHTSAQEKTDGRIANPPGGIEETPTQRIRRIKTPTQQPSTREKPDPRPADSADAEIDETPTQRIRRIKTPSQQPSTHGKTDERAADTAAVDVEEVDPAPDPSGDADTVLMPPVLAAVSDEQDTAADTEEGDGQKLEPIAAHTEKVDPAPDDSGDADTVLMTPVLAAVSDEQDTAADTEESDGQKLEPIAAQTEKVDLAAADPDDSDSLEETPVHPVVGAAADPFPRPEHQVVGPVPTRNPAGKKRLLSAGLAAIALLGLLGGGALFFAGRDGGEGTAQSVATGTATSTMPSKPNSEAPTGSTDTERDESTIQVKDLTASARPFQTVRIEGKYPSGADTTCGCSAGKKANGWPFRYLRRPISQASSPPTSSSGSQVVIRFACWTPTLARRRRPLS